MTAKINFFLRFCYDKFLLELIFVLLCKKIYMQQWQVSIELIKWFREWLNIIIVIDFSKFSEGSCWNIDVLLKLNSTQQFSNSHSWKTKASSWKARELRFACSSSCNGAVPRRTARTSSFRPRPAGARSSLPAWSTWAPSPWPSRSTTPAARNQPTTISRRPTSKYSFIHSFIFSDENWTFLLRFVSIQDVPNCRKCSYETLKVCSLITLQNLFLLGSPTYRNHIWSIFTSFWTNKPPK